MSERNATASWSGYAHQGQVGLLVALRKMQEVDPANYDRYFVQFEKREDIAIYELSVDGSTSIYHSVHQVKAYYSENNHLKSTYSSVLNGDDFDGCDENYIHTAVEITNWDRSTINNDNEVERYLYETGKYHCGTGEIEYYIKTEIQNILGENEPKIENSYLHLSSALDNKIRSEHQNGTCRADYNIQFSFTAIYTIIDNDEIFNQKEIYDCRKLFFDSFVSFVKLPEIDVDDAQIKRLNDNIFKEINKLDDKDFLAFLQLLNLNRNIQELQYTQIVYNQDGLIEVFFYALVKAISENPILKSNLVLFKKVSFPDFVLTAINSSNTFSRTTIKNIIDNLKSMKVLWENQLLINNHIDLPLIEGTPTFNSVGRPEELEEDRKRFMSYSKSKLISIDATLKILNDE